MDLASGTINYTPADIDILAINIQNDSGEYESSATIPTSGYVLSDTSYCDVNGEKDASIKITYENGSIAINDISKRTKCYLYFEKVKGEIIVSKIKNQSKGEKITFADIAKAADTGIYSAPDDYGTSYYFRGIEGSLNNWVKFAGFYWRIIRVNGNGTIRLIYSGEANGTILSSNKTGTTTQVEASAYNHTSNDNAYVGYMMGIPLNGTEQTANETTSHSSSYNMAHTNTYDSDAKIFIDMWYQNNIGNSVSLTKYIDLNTGFCNDRQVDKTAHLDYQGNGEGEELTGYAPWGRVMTDGSWKTTQKPTLQCTSKSRDLFTHTSASEGNKKLQYPVGMITMDEAIFAGGFGGKENLTYYLYTNQNYWTMSPQGTNSGRAVVFFVSPKGKIDSFLVTPVFGFRPVINLRADTKFIGSGSETDPFVVV